MPPNRKQVDITGEIHDELEHLASQSSVSVSAMARIVLTLGIAKYKNLGTTPAEAIASFDKWGDSGVSEVVKSGVDWLLEQESEVDQTGKLASAFILSQLGQPKIDGGDLIMLANALKVDGQKLQELLNKREKKRNGT